MFDISNCQRVVDRFIAEKFYFLIDELKAAETQKEYEAVRAKIKHCPEYSTDSNYVMPLIKDLKKRGIDCTLASNTDGYKAKIYFIEGNRLTISAAIESPIPNMAICLAIYNSWSQTNRHPEPA